MQLFHRGFSEIDKIHLNETNELWLELFFKEMVIKRTDRFPSGEEWMTFLLDTVCVLTCIIGSYVLCCPGDLNEVCTCNGVP